MSEISPASKKSETLRWDPKTKDLVEVVEDEKTRERLECLRTLSNELNKKLQLRLDQTGLPFYTWNKSGGSATSKQSNFPQPKIMRLAFMLRPMFFHSSEDKNTDTRYNTGDDQATIFIHLTPDNKVQIIRAHRGFGRSAFGLYFVTNILSSEDDPNYSDERALIEAAVAKGDMDTLADYFITRLNPEGIPERKKSYVQKMTEYFQKAYKLTSFAEAEDYFKDENIFLYQPKEIIRNIAKVVIGSLLERKAAGNKYQTLDELKTDLHLYTNEILSIVVNVYPKSTNLNSFIPDSKSFSYQIIQKIIKIYKPQILDWVKK